MSDFQAYNEASQHLNILRNTVALVEIALNDAAEGDKQVAPHVLAAVLYGTQHHLDTLEQLTTASFKPLHTSPSQSPTPVPSSLAYFARCGKKLLMQKSVATK